MTLEVNVSKDVQEWGYEAGPTDAMKIEIGQVVINHALCDPSLYELFHALSGIEERPAKIMVRALKIKSGAIVELIKAFHKARAPDLHVELSKRITACLTAYDQLSKARNLIAHWQWSLSDDGANVATTTNFLGMNHGDASGTKEHSLRSLKATSWGLMQVNIIISMVAAFVGGSIPDIVRESAFTAVDSLLAQTQEALLDIPDISAEELT